jgi:hypothetical protein
MTDFIQCVGLLWNLARTVVTIPTNRANPGRQSLGFKVRVERYDEYLWSIMALNLLDWDGRYILFGPGDFSLFIPLACIVSEYVPASASRIYLSSMCLRGTSCISEYWRMSFQQLQTAGHHGFSWLDWNFIIIPRNTSRKDSLVNASQNTASFWEFETELRGCSGIAIHKIARFYIPPMSVVNYPLLRPRLL